MIIDYFTTLLLSDDGNYDLVVNLLEPKVFPTDNYRLLAPVSIEEVKRAISPMPDGMNPTFFLEILEYYWA